ncbi:MAG: SH3 domain-containing protein, partial [Clostridia bacterium]|nr:SH3 domain-containing protein [Clostridia bacterium]
VNGVCWDSVRVVSSGTTGFMEDSRLARINSEQATYYLEELATPTPAPIFRPTAEPFEGYAKTLGEGAVLREYMNTNASIIQVLGENTVVSVYSQATGTDGDTWCLVQHGQYFGYVRRDMIAQMNEWEITGYLESMRTPTPSPQITATPRAASAMTTSYGYVSRDQVRLRSEPNTSSTPLRLMSRYEFAFVLETLTGADDQAWYRVLIGGQTGYVRSDCFRVLTQGELDTFLASDDYRSANVTETTVSGIDSIQSYEDYTQAQWQNPSLSASYEPFDPYGTPTPLPGGSATPSPTPYAQATPAPTIIASLNGDPVTPAPNSEGGSGFGGILIAFGVGIGLAAIGGAYAWYTHQRNKRRRAAQRVQQARRAQSAAARPPVREEAAGYRRDASSRSAYERPDGADERAEGQMSGSTRRTQRYDESVRRAPVDTTTRYRRPSDPSGAPSVSPYEVRSAETEGTRRMDRAAQPDDYAIYRRPAQQDAGAAETAASGTARHRRSERHTYDDEGN